MDVPRVKDEKPWFGPRAEDGSIQVQYPSMMNGNSFDAKTINLPKGFSVRHQQKKGEKRTFYCNICLVELSSEDTMIKHLNGVSLGETQHLGNASFCEKVKHTKRKGELGGESDGNEIIAIPNPPPTRIKVPVRLHQKITETQEPVVGLDYVTEVLPVSDPEMEPHYECHLCGSQGIANGMFSHLMGHKHRKNFVEEIYRDDIKSVMNLSQMELLKYAK